MIVIGTYYSGAEFSDCMRYRYSLWRRWASDPNGRLAMFIGLNPSTADEINNDPTVRRCIRFSMDWGYDGLIMMNSHGFRSTDPKGLKTIDDPAGPGNADALSRWSKKAALIIAAWGVHCPYEHEQAVCNAVGKTVHCLGRTKTGRPKHPLYLRADTKPEIFWTP